VKDFTRNEVKIVPVQAMKVCGRVDVQVGSYCRAILATGKRSPSSPTEWGGFCLGQTAGLDELEEEKI